MHRTRFATVALALAMAWCVIARPSPAQPASDLAILLGQGREALAKGDWTLAEARFETAREQAPDDPRGWLGSTAVAMGREDWVAALGAARQARLLDPDSAPAALAMARALIRLDQDEAALRALGDVRRLAPTEVEGYLLAAVLMRDDGESEAAIAVLEAAGAAGIVDPDVDEMLGLLALRAGDTGRAAAVAETAGKRHPDHAGLALVAGLARRTDPALREAAVLDFERALALGTTDPGRVHLELGTLLVELGRLEPARQQLLLAGERLPDLAEVHYRLGTALRAAGDVEGAREALARFQALSTAHDTAERAAKARGTALNEAQGLATENRLEEALVAVDAVLDGQPDDARAQALRAKVLFSLRRAEDALDAISRARSLAPGRVENHFLEGMFAVGVGAFEVARPALEHALVLDPDLGEAHELLGLIAGQEERFAEAAGHFDRALALGREGRRLRLAYAEVLSRLGRQAESEAQRDAYRQLAGSG